MTPEFAEQIHRALEHIGARRDATAGRSGGEAQSGRPQKERQAAGAAARGA
jgi:hypothetical protein